MTMKLEGQGRRKVVSCLARLCSLQGKESGESLHSIQVNAHHNFKISYLKRDYLKQTNREEFFSYPVLT